jgi:dTDP-4-dehydrorhamnose 3,5-epimerase
MATKPVLTEGGLFTDLRGSLRYVNDANHWNYCRFYLIRPSDTESVRAWQGHKQEEKTFFAVKGTFLIAVITPEDFENPTENEQPAFYRLSEQNNYLLHVPGGCYTGIKSLCEDAQLLVLSNTALASSKADDFREPKQKWVDWEKVK